MDAVNCNPFQDFFQLLKLLLITINRTFPECEKTREFMCMLDFLDSSELSDEKDRVIKTWYETMKPYIKDCKAQNDNIILRADIGLLEEMDIRTKWSDPEFDQESKNVLWEYINELNYFACLHCETSPEKLEGISAIATQLMGKSDFKMEDGKISFNINAIQSIMENDGIMKLMESFTSGEGNDMSGIKAFLDCGMTDFTSFLPKK